MGRRCGSWGCGQRGGTGPVRLPVLQHRLRRNSTQRRPWPPALPHSLFRHAGGNPSRGRTGRASGGSRVRHQQTPGTQHCPAKPACRPGQGWPAGRCWPCPGAARHSLGWRPGATPTGTAPRARLLGGGGDTCAHMQTHRHTHRCADEQPRTRTPTGARSHAPRAFHSLTGLGSPEPAPRESSARSVWRGGQTPPQR